MAKQEKEVEEMFKKRNELMFSAHMVIIEDLRGAVIAQEDARQKKDLMLILKNEIIGVALLRILTRMKIPKGIASSTEKDLKKIREACFDFGLFPKKLDEAIKLFSAKVD